VSHALIPAEDQTAASIWLRPKDALGHSWFAFMCFVPFVVKPVSFCPVLILSSSDLFDRSLFQRMMNRRGRRHGAYLRVPLRTLRLNLTDRESPFATCSFPLRLGVFA
jgi:hypothetical protein